MPRGLKARKNGRRTRDNDGDDGEDVENRRSSERDGENEGGGYESKECEESNGRGGFVRSAGGWKARSAVEKGDVGWARERQVAFTSAS